MKEILDSLKLQIHERLSSPLLGTFILSWIGWNYRLLAVLFSKMPVESKFEFIDNELRPDLSGTGLWYPVLTTIGFLVFYPLISYVVLLWWNNMQRVTKRLKDKIDGQTLLTEDEGRQLRLEIIRKEQDFGVSIRNLQSEKEGLRKINGELQSKVNNLSAQLATKGEQPKKITGEMRVVEMLAKAGGRMEADKVREALAEPELRVDHYFKEGVKKDLFQHGISGNTRVITLTEKGREAAVIQNFV